MAQAKATSASGLSPLFMVHGAWHKQMLALFMVLALFHFGEHLLQIIQVFVLQWARSSSGGLLGLWRPDLLSSELLHFAYNTFQFVGLVVLLGGFSSKAQRWWKIAILFQGWHFIEHTLLQAQWLTKLYLYDGPKPMSVFEFLMPRIELHFLYNLMVMVPTVIALYFYFRDNGLPFGGTRGRNAETAA